jgi:hypothetical protein
MQSPAATDVPLPPERAFVVQLRPRTDPSGEVFVGRVEHIASGTFARFASAAELTAFIARIGSVGLDQPGDGSTAESPPASTSSRGAGPHPLPFGGKENA